MNQLDSHRTVDQIVEEVLSHHHYAKPELGRKCEGYPNGKTVECGERRDVLPCFTALGIFYFCADCRREYRVQGMPNA